MFRALIEHRSPRDDAGPFPAPISAAAAPSPNSAAPMMSVGDVAFVEKTWPQSSTAMTRAFPFARRRARRTLESAPRPARAAQAEQRPAAHVAAQTQPSDQHRVEAGRGSPVVVTR